MYKVKLDGYVLYHADHPSAMLTDPVLELEPGYAGVFTATVPPDNPLYDRIFCRKSMVSVFRNNREIFYGEVRKVPNIDRYRNKQIYCTGALSFLADSIQPQAEYHDISPAALLGRMLEIHNSQVEPRKQIKLGYVSITDPNNSLYRYTNYENTLEAIREKLVSRLGGYLRLRHVGDQLILDWVSIEQYGSYSTQPIEFGLNLLDYSETTSAEDVVTALIPLGATLEGESEIEALEKRVDITSANDGKVYLFFDEIQEVKDWEKCINSFRVSLDCDIYITGSNAKLLSGELATYLGGRYVEFVIYPFSFGEFMELYRSIAPDASIQQCFQKYLLAGGMPYLANLRYADAPSKQYLHDLFNSVQLKDIVKRNKIRDVDLLERIIAYVIANVGTTFSATSLAKFLKNEQRTVAPETILNYIKYCCEAYLFYQVKREDLQGKQILASNEKYYIADHGIREAVFGGNMRDINLILENIVYLELLRRGYEVTVGRTGDKEIDFVCDKRGEKLYVQVTYLLASGETVNREFGAYDNIRDNFPKYVVSLDEFDMSRNGIKHRNIRDFLLDEEWN